MLKKIYERNTDRIDKIMMVKAIMEKYRRRRERIKVNAKLKVNEDQLKLNT